jgi:hypothetical protein
VLRCVKLGLSGLHFFALDYVGEVVDCIRLAYVWSGSFAFYNPTYHKNNLLTYLLHGAESFLRS